MGRVAFVLFFFGVASKCIRGSSSEARAVTTELTVEKYDWLSSEVVVIDASVRNAPYNMELKVSWDLVGESNLVITNGTYLFKATGTITELQFELEKFYQGDHFYSFEFEITDEIGSVLDESEQSFTVFEHYPIPLQLPILSPLAILSPTWVMGTKVQ